MKVLIIDDDKDLVSSLKESLSNESFVVEFALDGEKGSYLARHSSYDVIILDYNLPKIPGDKVLEDIRRVKKHVPVLILSAYGDIHSRINFLEAGADDFLTKPFSIGELLARMRALLRRPPQIQGFVFEIGDLVLDSRKHLVKRAGKGIYLTRKEFSLLELLIKNAGMIVTRNEILEHVWNSDGDPFSNTVEAHILNLRKKINEGNSKELIQNYPGRGYKIDVKK